MLLPQTDHFGEALAAADLAVSRAGGTVWELAAAGTPAVLVPYPHATADHQTLNARHFERGGGAIVVPDAEVELVPGLVADLLADPARLERDARRNARPGAAGRGRGDRGRADRACARWPMTDDRAIGRARQASPLRGRQLYFVGIGGSGMSAYANAASALGAEVRGWDLRETIFTATLGEIEVDLGGEPRPPEGWEVVVSTAHATRIDGRPRAAFLAELVAAQPSIVVAGAHGKTTTAGMIAFALREAGADPSWIVGGVVPQLGGNAGVGSGWLVAEGDESDRSLFALRPQIAVVTNIELDHHATYASEAELRAELEAWLADVPAGGARVGARAGRLRARRPRCAQPGERRRRDGGARARGCRPRRRPKPRSTRFTGAGRRFELVGERGGVTVYDDYGHNPTELRATLETARERTAGNLIAVYQPHVYERTRHLAQELADALGLADAAVVTEVTGARDEPRDGVSGRWVLERLPPHVRAGWAPTLDDAAAPGAPHGPARRRRGDVRSGGAVEDRPGDRGRAAVVTLVVDEGVELSRWTTIGTGGPARAFAQPATVAELEEALAFAAAEGLGVVVIGLGSNVLAADAGVDALVLRLTGELADVRADGELLRRGRRRDERGLPAPRARRRARRPRVRVRDPGHGRRGCAHERGCVRVGLGGDPRRARSSSPPRAPAG